MIRFLTENLGLKLLAAGLALVIFLGVRSEQELTTSVAVKLVVRESPDLINTNELPPEILVRVSGGAAAIRALSPDELRTVEIDLSMFGRGISTVRIQEEQIGLPAEVQVVSISPSALTLRLEPRERKTLEVKAVTKGEVAKGHKLVDLRATPAKVELEGPRRELLEARFVRTLPLDLTDARATLTAELPLEAPGTHVRIVDVSRAKVIAEIALEQGERTVQLRVIYPGVKEPIAIRARLRGPKLMLDALDETTIRAEATLDPSRRSRGSVPVQVLGLPTGVTVVAPLSLDPRQLRKRG